MRSSYGGIAQLGEHLPCKQGVRSSNLLISIGQQEEKLPERTLKTAYQREMKKFNFNRREKNLFFLKENREKNSFKEPCPYTTLVYGGRRSSREERRADALALGADERRDKLRKAAERSKYPVTRRCLNGETRQEKLLSSMRQSITHGGEPGELKHLSSRRKRKQISDFLSSGERKGKSPNRIACDPGFGLRTSLSEDSGMVLGKPAGEGESPVGEIRRQTAGSRVPRDTWNLVGKSGDHPVRLNTTQ